MTLTAAAVLGVAAAPAMAQPWRDHYAYGGGYGRNEGSNGELRAQEWRIRQAVQQGEISRGQAAQLFDELSDLRPVAWRLDNGRWNNPDYQRLARGLGHVQAQLNVFASRRDDYADGYGRDWRR
ncbi:MAG: hypothetical protein ACHP7A_07910 [Caulobacterales bacterium]